MVWFVVVWTCLFARILACSGLHAIVSIIICAAYLYLSVGILQKYRCTSFDRTLIYRKSDFPAVFPDTTTNPDFCTLYTGNSADSIPSLPDEFRTESEVACTCTRYPTCVQEFSANVFVRNNTKIGIGSGIEYTTTMNGGTSGTTLQILLVTSTTETLIGFGYINDDSKSMQSILWLPVVPKPFKIATLLPITWPNITDVGFLYVVFLFSMFLLIF